MIKPMHVVGGVKGRVRSLGHRRVINKTDLGLKYWSYNYYFSSSEGGRAKRVINVISAVAQGEFECLVGRREREHSGKGGVGGGGKTESGSTRVCDASGHRTGIHSTNGERKEKRAKG